MQPNDLTKLFPQPKDGDWRIVELTDDRIVYRINGICADEPQYNVRCLEDPRKWRVKKEANNIELRLSQLYYQLCDKEEVKEEVYRAPSPEPAQSIPLEVDPQFSPPSHTSSDKQVKRLPITRSVRKQKSTENSNTSNYLSLDLYQNCGFFTVDNFYMTQDRNTINPMYNQNATAVKNPSSIDSSSQPNVINKDNTTMAFVNKSQNGFGSTNEFGSNPISVGFNENGRTGVENSFENNIPSSDGFGSFNFSINNDNSDNQIFGSENTGFDPNGFAPSSSNEKKSNENFESSGFGASGFDDNNSSNNNGFGNSNGFGLNNPSNAFATDKIHEVSENINEVKSLGFGDGGGFGRTKTGDFDGFGKSGFGDNPSSGGYSSNGFGDEPSVNNKGFGSSQDFGSSSFGNDSFSHGFGENGFNNNSGRSRGQRRDENSRSARGCFNCGEDGHRAMNCTRPKKERRGKICFNCDKEGHMSRECTEPRKQKPRGGFGQRGGRGRGRGQDFGNSNNRFGSNNGNGGFGSSNNVRSFENSSFGETKFGNEGFSSNLNSTDDSTIKNNDSEFGNNSGFGADTTGFITSNKKGLESADAFGNTNEFDACPIKKSIESDDNWGNSKGFGNGETLSFGESNRGRDRRGRGLNNRGSGYSVANRASNDELFSYTLDGEDMMDRLYRNDNRKYSAEIDIMMKTKRPRIAYEDNAKDYYNDMMENKTTENRKNKCVEVITLSD